MTFSAEELVDLLDQAMMSGDWHSIRIFNGAAVGSGGIMVSMGRDHSAFTVDQLVPEARPSEKLFWLLNHNLRPTAKTVAPTTIEAPRASAMDDLLDDI